MALEEKKWTFPSKSNPKAVPHETTLWDDGHVTCNCFGWTKRVADDGSRTCPHVRMVDQGLADQYALAVWNNPRLQASSTRRVSSEATRVLGDSRAKSNKRKLAAIREQLKKEETDFIPTRKVNWEDEVA